MKGPVDAMFSDDNAFAESLARVRFLVNKEQAPPQPANLPGDLAVYVALRRNGERLADAWSPVARTQDPLASAIASALKNLGSASHPDTVEIVFSYLFRPVDADKTGQIFNNLNRGRIGIQLTSGDRVTRYAPTQMIATNLPFKKIIETFFAEEVKRPVRQAKPVIIRRFEAMCFLVPLTEGQPPVRLFRGNKVVLQDEVTAETTAALARRMSDWMLTNLNENGRMTYKYWPSRGEESTANNMIRQWMASVALARIGRYFEDDDVTARALLNIHYNLKEFGARKEDLEFIYFGDEANLGAAALAALAIREHPKERILEQTERRLRNTVEHLWHEDGSFTSFLIPPGENRNQNFYPGEALVYLAGRYAEEADPTLLDRIMKSVAHYREWHLNNRNPAFVPWHVMAYETVWMQTRDADLRDWIFEMSDWLCGLQVADSTVWPDIAGRFYDPERRQFGRPHASATGVYLEGMIAAWRVARGSGDTSRQERYRSSITRGLRSLMQLEFSGEADMFYISKRGKVSGGLRTTVYNNEIRVDNVQHGLMAILQILHDFSPADYKGTGA
ncbi:hypothetical protein SAMN05444000_1502 [Shimia gijangensis]|uniref:Uncharacterized protein n=1 Tax=Shimia gijangensis TaxID=1470563 RepID=A0A1M6U223_9RHOB|nr:hypothetical protein [Shimia gijangensis]SHK63322.1 hypothetical protein SAMN05444000_1502 [Shimia gijangensis]